MKSHQRTRRHDLASVFICYAKEDVAVARRISRELRRAGVSTWFDEEQLVLGDDWQREIEQAIAAADALIVCLRPGFEEVGFRHKEVRWARDALAHRPVGAGFIIPFIVEPCEIPRWCRGIHAGVSLDKPTEMSELLRAVAKHTGAKLERRPQAVERPLLYIEVETDSWSEDDFVLCFLNLERDAAARAHREYENVPLRDPVTAVTARRQDLIQAWLDRTGLRPEYEKWAEPRA